MITVVFVWCVVIIIHSFAGVSDSPVEVESLVMIRPIAVRALQHFFVTPIFLSLADFSSIRYTSLIVSFQLYIYIPVQGLAAKFTNPLTHNS